jgi:hypothetical protein
MIYHYNWSLKKGNYITKRLILYREDEKIARLLQESGLL